MSAGPKPRKVAIKFVRKTGSAKGWEGDGKAEAMLRHEAAMLKRVRGDMAAGLTDSVQSGGEVKWDERKANIARSRIVSLIDVIETDEYFAMVMELAEGGELYDKILAGAEEEEKNSTDGGPQDETGEDGHGEGEGMDGVGPGAGGIPELEAKKVIRELAQAVAFLHHENISHRDLKLENVLLTSNSHVKLGDFGLSRPVDPGSPHTSARAGSDPYLSPELVLHRPSDPRAADIWAMGVVLFAMLTARLPFDSNHAALRAGVAEIFGRGPVAHQLADSVSRRKMYARIAKAEYDFTEGERKMLSEDARDLVSRMLCKDPAARITAEEILRHPFVEDGWVLDDDEEQSQNQSSKTEHDAARGRKTNRRGSDDPPWHVRVSSTGELTFADLGPGAGGRGGWMDEAFAALARVAGGGLGVDFRNGAGSPPPPPSVVASAYRNVAAAAAAR
ncbi:hypothetical protein HK104_001199 [Borealophlyctis nickersoniae]|nr:hypothetical protein HK104_001199 [Borealophlyctis nickersoniae]